MNSFPEAFKKMSYGRIQELARVKSLIKSPQRF